MTSSTESLVLATLLLSSMTTLSSINSLVPLPLPLLALSQHSHGAGKYQNSFGSMKERGKGISPPPPT